MDENVLAAAASRIAAEKDPKKKGPAPEPEDEPNWQKIRNEFETSIRSTFADLRSAIKDEDSKLTVYQMKRMMDALVFLAKFMRMRDVYLRLQQVDKKLFG